MSAQNKNLQPLVVFVVILALITFAVIFCYSKLEIVDDTRWKDPSREARANPYLALDRWLGAAGYTVRSLPLGSLTSILQVPGQTVFLEASRCNWAKQDDAANMLIPWIQQGGRLIVSLDVDPDPRLEAFMDALGIRVVNFYDLVKSENKVPDETEADETEYLAFDWQRSFELVEKKSVVDRVRIITSLKAARMIQLELGKGWVTFTGEANFLRNAYLKHHAALARELFFNGSVDRGVLFIRGLTGERSLLGNLASRGDPRFMGLALALLVIAGFWMVIPSFGRYRPAPEKPGKPLRERFLAEGRFYKKYHALAKYIEVYEKELAIPPAPKTAAAAKKPAEISMKAFIKAQLKYSDQLKEKP